LTSCFAKIYKSELNKTTEEIESNKIRGRIVIDMARAILNLNDHFQVDIITFWQFYSFDFSTLQFSTQLFRVKPYVTKFKVRFNSRINLLIVFVSEGSTIVSIDRASGEVQLKRTLGFDNSNFTFTVRFSDSALPPHQVRNLRIGLSFL
jgi:hypothetical protein